MHEWLGVILTAGGSSTRFGENKLTATLGGMAVLTRTILAFNAHATAPPLDKILVAIPPRLPDDAPLKVLQRKIRDLTGDCIFDFVEVGGASRAETVRNAVDLFEKQVKWIAVHDGARPLVSSELISRVCDAALAHGAAAPALPVALTIKQARGPLPATVQRTVPRHDLWAMQTPQVMRRRDLLEAFKRCPLPLDQVTDDVQLLELASVPVTLVAGEERNLKLTTPLDLRLAELLLEG